MPVIEVDILLDQYRAGKLQDYNLLLLWSIFFVAVNVIFQALVLLLATLIRHDSLSRAMFSKRKVMHLGGK